MNIGSASGSPRASTNINIRGITSFTGSNQPLLVVDGIIMSNDTDNTQNTWFGSQPSNRLGDIAPEMIESINILKGPAASVLYGSRASSGALIITTKSGRGLKDKTKQRNGTAGNGGSAMGQITRIPRSYDFGGTQWQDELGAPIYYNISMPILKTM